MSESPFFILDENVPASVAQVIAQAGYSVSYIRDHIALGSPDPVVAAYTEHTGGILVTHDKDFKSMISRAPMARRRDTAD